MGLLLIPSKLCYVRRGGGGGAVAKTKRGGY